MTVRPASVEDAAAIAEIWNRYIRETAVTFTSQEKTPAGIAADIAARQNGGMAFFVAEEASRIVGFATSFPFRSGSGYRHTLEHSVQLVQGAEGRGVGRALIARIEAAARSGGVRTLVAVVSGENPQAIAFYQALGFREVGRMPEVGKKFGRWIDIVLMQKFLSESESAR